MDLKTVGMPMAGHKYEGNTGYFWDTLVYPGSIKAGDNPGTKQTINRVTLFNSPKKRDELQNTAFPMAQYRQYTIEGIGIEHNLLFDNPNDLEIFEKSYLKITMLDSEYANIPISSLLNYNRINSPDKTDTDRVNASIYLQRSSGGVVRKIDPIVVPEGVDIRIEFVPGGNNLVTVPINQENGFKWGAGLFDNADSPTQFVRINLIGTLLRQKAV